MTKIERLKTRELVAAWSAVAAARTSPRKHRRALARLNNITWQQEQGRNVLVPAGRGPSLFNRALALFARSAVHYSDENGNGKFYYSLRQFGNHHHYRKHSL